MHDLSRLLVQNAKASKNDEVSLEEEVSQNNVETFYVLGQIKYELNLRVYLLVTLVSLRKGTS